MLQTAATILGELRSLQDWFVRYQLNAVQGVAEVASIGGFVKQYQVEVDSQKMRTLGVSLGMVMNAVSRSNLNVGGKTVEENGMEFIVRGIGLIQSIRDLEMVVLLERNGIPVYLKDVARVEVGGDFRRGVLDVDGREVVGGIVVMRTGENAHEVIRRVKEKVAQITPSLPPGITIKAFYDRSELIDRTIETLKHALTEEILLVTLAHIIFLFHFRSILIVTLPLPVSILISFILMKQFGITSNIMSLSGIAIAIGVLVDAAIVLTENVIRHAEDAERTKGARLSRTETFDVVLAASQASRPTDLLRDGDHYPRLCAGIRAHRTGGEALPSARLHEDLRNGRLDATRGHDRASPLHLACARSVPFGRPQRGHAVLAASL